MECISSLPPPFLDLLQWFLVHGSCWLWGCKTDLKKDTAFCTQSMWIALLRKQYSVLKLKLHLQIISADTINSHIHQTTKVLYTWDSCFINRLTLPTLYGDFEDHVNNVYSGFKYVVSHTMFTIIIFAFTWLAVVPFTSSGASCSEWLTLTKPSKLVPEPFSSSCCQYKF